MSELKNGVERENHIFSLNNLVFKTEVLTCFNTTLSNYLRIKGIDLSESDIYFLCGYTNPDSTIVNVSQKRFALPYVQFDILINNLFSDTDTNYEIYFDKEYQFISLDVNPDTFKDKTVMLALSTAVLNHLLFPTYPDQGTIHCVISSEIDKNKIMKVTDYFNIDSTGKINVWDGEYAYEDIKEGLLGYLNINHLDTQMLEKKRANLLNYAMKEFEGLVYDTGTHPAGGLGFIEDLFDLYEVESGKDKVSEQRDIFRMNLMLQAKHLLFFGYTCDLISKYTLKDGENMCQRLREMKYAWQRVINKLLIQTLAYSRKRTTTILSEARELIKQQRELVLELIDMYRNEYDITYNG
ncbi:hypothetical protein [Anaerosporobacter faecicola]|uniref:hypothetical protein n=1 Tax=Anaerosporobacter faecicola TaxID=2718714 RepID=UPI0014390410|nr:hypothetical protein [Anaerosporobacter faecicola]